MQVGELVKLSAYGKKLKVYESFSNDDFGVILTIEPCRYRVSWRNGCKIWHVRRDLVKIKKV